MPTQATVSARRGFLGAQSRRHSRIALANSRPICVRLDRVRNSLGCAARIQRRLIICFHAHSHPRLERHHAGNDQRPGEGPRPIATRVRGHDWVTVALGRARVSKCKLVSGLACWSAQPLADSFPPYGGPTCFLTQRYCSALSAQWLGCGLVTKQVKAAGSIACSRAAIRRKPLRPLKQERRTTGANPSLVRPPRSNRATS